jgi:hypothetical protein
MQAYPVHGESPTHKSRWRSPWRWFGIAAAIAALALGIGYGVVGVAQHHKATTHYGIFATHWVPTEKTWHPSTGYYCAGVGGFSSPKPDPNVVATVVNAAPTKAAHEATLALWRDLVAGRSTSTALAAVQTAYTCAK